MTSEIHWWSVRGSTGNSQGLTASLKGTVTVSITLSAGVENLWLSDKWMKRIPTVFPWKQKDNGLKSKHENTSSTWLMKHTSLITDLILVRVNRNSTPKVVLSVQKLELGYLNLAFTEQDFSAPPQILSSICMLKYFSYSCFIFEVKLSNVSKKMHTNLTPEF